MTALPAALWAAIALAWAIGAGAGAWVSGLYHGRVIAGHERQIAQLERDTAAAGMRAAEAASVALYEAQERGDALTRDLSAARRAAATLKKERDDALAHATTGRVCLDAGALGVLDGAPGIHVDLPAPAGGAAGADAGIVATDADVGRWALAAGEHYAECRRRHQALIDWHTRGAP